MEHVVSSIKFAAENKLQLVEVFQFKNSSFVITIASKEFESNLDNIHKFYKQEKISELCERVEKVKEILKTNPDEKEKSDKHKPTGSSR